MQTFAVKLIFPKKTHLYIVLYCVQDLLDKGRALAIWECKMARKNLNILLNYTVKPKKIDT